MLASERVTRMLHACPCVIAQVCVVVIVVRARAAHCCRRQWKKCFQPDDYRRPVVVDGSGGFVFVSRSGALSGCQESSSFSAPRDGRLVLTFDNSYSWVLRSADSAWKR